MAQNKDRESPNGFCAYLHHKFTGEWPSENEEQVEASTEVINGRLDFSDEDLNVHTFSAAPSLKDVFGVQIFHAGVHRDSKGNEREWTKDQLAQMVANFEGGAVSEVPLKLGHTSPEHTAAIAKALGIPAPILLGEEGFKKGAASLGRVKKVFIGDEGIVRADFEMNGKVEKLVQSGYFGTVSAEIIPDYRGMGPVLSGLALLGADRPAIKSLNGLSQADFLQQVGKVTAHSQPTEGAEVYLFELEFEDPDELTSLGQYRVPVTEQAVDGNGKVMHRVTTVRHVRASNGDEAKTKVKNILKQALGYAFTVIAQSATSLVIELVAQDLRTAYNRSYGGQPFSRRLPGFRKAGRAWRDEQRSRGTEIHKLIYTLGLADRIADFKTVRPYGYSEAREDEEPSEFALGLALATIGAYKIGKKLYRVAVAPRAKGPQTQRPVAGQMAPVILNVWGYTPKHAQLNLQGRLTQDLEVKNLSKASSHHEEFIKGLNFPAHPDDSISLYELVEYEKHDKDKKDEESNLGTLISIGGSPVAAAGIAKAHKSLQKGYKKAKTTAQSRRVQKKVVRTGAALASPKGYKRLKEI